MQLPRARLEGTGHVRPPKDMLNAARKSLTPAGFEALMRVTEGEPPTPDQLVFAVEEERHVARV